jgi:D-aminopeptidase
VESKEIDMTDIDIAALEKLAEGLPRNARGPGGAIGVVHEGRVVLRHAWGHADPKAHRPVTPATRFPICSISKQFTCGVLLDLVEDRESLAPALARLLRNFETRRPTISELCHNQSGLRDYWALTVLYGAHAEGVFAREDAARLFSRMRDTHFEPGTRYSYSNGNFRLLSDLIEEKAGRSLADLYRERIFDRAGMETAELIPDTSEPADGVVGFEGNDATGYFPAVNRIIWTGDAGISASLDDMLAWEAFIDRTREDENGLYRRLSAPQTFADGHPAPYGFGVSHEMVSGIALTGHSGALRGFRAHRMHAAEKRLSVVVLFNHEANARDTAAAVLRAALGLAEEKPVTPAAGPEWEGRWLDAETGLLLTTTPSPSGVSATFAGGAEVLAVTGDREARSAAMSMMREVDVLRFRRWRENLDSTARRVSGTPRADIAGVYESSGIDARLAITGEGLMLHGFFEGFLGRGEMTPVLPVAEDLFVMPCRRSMDAPAPGDWTLRVKRGADGTVDSIELGSWLARHIDYRKIG